MLDARSLAESTDTRSHGAQQPTLVFISDAPSFDRWHVRVEWPVAEGMACSIGVARLETVRRHGYRSTHIISLQWDSDYGTPPDDVVELVREVLVESEQTAHLNFGGYEESGAMHDALEGERYAAWFAAQERAYLASKEAV